MSNAIRFTGLATGLDTDNVVERLMEVEAQGKRRIEWTKGLWDARRTAWTSVNTSLATLDTASVTLFRDSTWSTPADAKRCIVEWVTAYNGSIDLMAQQSAARRIPRPESLAQYTAAPLSHSNQLTSIAGSLRRAVSDPIAGLAGSYDTLSDIGITTGEAISLVDADRLKGKLQIDDAKLTAALDADPAAVRALFGSAVVGSEGIARRVDSIARSLRLGGTVDLSIKGASQEVIRQQQSIDRFDARLERKRVQLERMFSQLETTIGKMQQQSSWLSGQLAGLG